MISEFTKMFTKSCICFDYKDNSRNRKHNHQNEPVFLTEIYSKILIPINSFIEDPVTCIIY